jgi:bla regulator protein blaR1
MRSSELLLTFLLNACWQIPLVAAVASLGAWLLRHTSARYRHWVWVSALLLSLLIPLAASSRVWFADFPAPASESNAVMVDTETVFQSRVVSPSASSSLSGVEGSAILLSQGLALGVIAVYLGFLLFSSFRLFAAWSTTRTIKQAAEPIVMSDAIARIVERCQSAIGSRRIEILGSSSVPVPITMGIFKPVIILPEQLLLEGDENLLTSAIGHEAIHVARRDYLFNLFYELIYLTLSFHPAAALIRRRIKQTRELSCDELVALQMLEPEIYARSLVTLASSAPPLRRLSVTATVGIADADILEVRIMSLMKKSRLDARSKKISLIAAALLLIVSSVTAVALAMRFDVEPVGISAAQEQENKQKEKEKQIEKEKRELGERSREFEEGVRAAQEELKLKRSENFEAESEGRRWRVEEELKARDIMQAALLRLARIPMDQAIQIAVSQQPGKVIQSSLAAKGWEEPGKLAKDGQVFYHVIVLSGDENSPTRTHVWVNAIDGTIIRTEKELWRKMRQPEP